MPPRASSSRGTRPWRRVAAAVALALVLTGPAAARARDGSLHGTVRDAESGKPIAFVTVTMDTSETRLTSTAGYFDFGDVSAGRHVLSFDHIAYRRRWVTVEWPGDRGGLAVKLEPSQFETEKIVVHGERVPPSFPVGAVSVNRAEITAVPGNIANDPLRTIQSQPSCATDGVDFLSKMAIRGGDAEEHRVYFDGYPLRHYSHVSGYTGVVYDDMLARTVLIPGAAPMAYNGTLSGVIALESVKADTTLRSFRYDITSMAAGMSEPVAPTLAVQASAKTSFFNLPVYRDVGVEKRTFRDFLGRAIVIPSPALTVTSTLLWASDSETGNFFVGEDKRRELKSLLAGVDASWRPPGWGLTLRPYYSRYDSRDALTFPEPERAHLLNDVRLHAKVAREGELLAASLQGEAGHLTHEGNGGHLDDTPYSAAAEVKFIEGDRLAVVLGVGASREPFTAKAEPEAYGSVRVGVGGIASVSAGARRSHQSPFIFSQRRYFASFPVDAGDLLSAYVPTWKDAPAVRMDQLSVETTLDLPFGFVATYDGFWREYDRLLTWEWQDFPGVSDVRSGGDGHGYGYEVSLRRDDPDLITLTVALSRARVWKHEGTLLDEKVGDFDRPASWQAGLSARLSRRVRLSLRWMDVDGRPYTRYDMQTTAPAQDDINALRLRRFRRLDAKIIYRILGDDFDGELFLDVINVTNRSNISMRYAVESDPGVFTSVPYGGTRWFPIAGATVRW